ncbi:hypothetical protein VP1G_10985 [Cytospora mali]|uniref:Uncharacterized protein n=1 Tax=Cytospora mali TaxID=578113 RepID=A0A194UZD3_CYTMA|nr:hypothetical protein VP1G_10985 [Valsa mali var. pyri (nom. inval.)]
MPPPPNARHRAPQHLCDSEDAKEKKLSQRESRKILPRIELLRSTAESQPYIIAAMDTVLLTKSFISEISLSTSSMN